MDHVFVAQRIDQHRVRHGRARVKASIFSVSHPALVYAISDNKSHGDVVPITAIFTEMVTSANGGSRGVPAQKFVRVIVTIESHDF